MEIIKLDATASTNDFLKNWYAKNPSTSTVVAWTLNQTDGRGQRGNRWESEPYKNLTFSVGFPFSDLEASSWFLLHQATALAILEVLNSLKIPACKIKWPNDILSVDRKIGGVLIETTTRGPKISLAIVGVGMNVNQDYFEDLPRASSLFLETGKTYDLNQLLNEILNALKRRFEQLSLGESFLSSYNEHLFGLGKTHQFIDAKSNVFEGKIMGVDAEGRLKIDCGLSGVLTADFQSVKMML